MPTQTYQGPATASTIATAVSGRMLHTVCKKSLGEKTLRQPTHEIDRRAAPADGVAGFHGRRAHDQQEQADHGGRQHDADRTLGQHAAAHRRVGQRIAAPRRLKRGLAGPRCVAFIACSRHDAGPGRAGHEKQERQRREEDQERIGRGRAGQMTLKLQTRWPAPGPTRTRPPARTSAGPGGRSAARCRCRTRPTQKRAANSVVPNT